MIFIQKFKLLIVIILKNGNSNELNQYYKNTFFLPILNLNIIYYIHDSNKK